jgi:hypothetical protein
LKLLLLKPPPGGGVGLLVVLPQAIKNATENTAMMARTKRLRNDITSP